MSDYNYLNARIKSLRRGLLSKARFDELLGLTDFEEFKRFFLDSPYGTAVSESLAQHPGHLGLEMGLSRHLHKNFQNILEWSDEEPRRLLEIFLRRYDLHNIKTLLRGKNGKFPSETILESLIPVGTFGFEELSELSKQPSLRDTLNLLSSWHKPLKRVLHRGLGTLKQEPVDLRELEAELDRYYYEGILLSLEEEAENTDLVKRFIQMEVDMTNILTLLRLKDLSREQLLKFIIDGGFLGKGFLLLISGSLKPMEVMQKFEATYLATVVRSWNPGRGLTDLERRFEAFLLRDVQRMERVDPLSIGVAIFYFSLLSDELKKLRIILQGKLFAIDETKLREELLLV